MMTPAHANSSVPSSSALAMTRSGGMWCAA
jgi:hypothetical protein